MARMTLSRWFCDACGASIDSAADGIVVFQRKELLAAEHFMIVHKQSAPGHPRCDPRGPTRWVDLTTLLGVDGLTYLLSFLSVGPLMGHARAGVVDHDGFVDLVRRVQIPFYEEARPQFHEESVQEQLGDANEVYPYLPETLKRIADGTI